MKYGDLSELEAIAAGTYNGGVTLNLEGEVGGVAPGMLADLLVVAGDPTEDITGTAGQDANRDDHPGWRDHRGRTRPRVVAERAVADLRASQPHPRARPDGRGIALPTGASVVPIAGNPIAE